MKTECKRRERQRTMAACLVSSPPGHSQGGEKTRYGGDTEHLEQGGDVLKPQPVHSTAHSVVVGQLLDGTWWREARGTNQAKRNQ